MAASSFSDFYDLLRVATGNEDPIVGAETLSADRIDVLLRTVALTLQGYSESFPTLTVDSVNKTLALAATPTDPLTSALTLAVVYAAAHRYFTGIGQNAAAQESIGMVYRAAELVSGSAIVGVNETDLAAAQLYKMRKQQEATAQTNLR